MLHSKIVSNNSWLHRRDGVRAQFVGRVVEDRDSTWKGLTGPPRESEVPSGKDASSTSTSALRGSKVEALGDSSIGLAWVEQAHSDSVRVVDLAGSAGVGDALVTSNRRLGLAVVTADCVPILLSDGDRIAAVHAGWRGLSQEILRRTLDHFAFRSRVWACIGPAIGPCCYEVGTDVAAAVAGVSAPEVVLPLSPRPHLDLRLAAKLQLIGLQVESIETLGPCSQCHPDRLWSYRRDGSQPGRNRAFIWFESS